MAQKARDFFANVQFDISDRRHTFPGGPSVTITGTGFNGTTAVDFGFDLLPNPYRVSSTSITAVSPTGTTGRRSRDGVNSLGTKRHELSRISHILC